MRHALALITAAALAAIALVYPEPAQATEQWPDIPPEIGVRQLRPVGLFPYRCSDGLVYNFYHGALYSEPPAIYLGQTYRPYYRYTAARATEDVFLFGEVASEDCCCRFY
jgi:hypothetical protein